MENTILLLCLLLALGLVIVVLLLLVLARLARLKPQKGTADIEAALRYELERQLGSTRQELEQQLSTTRQELSRSINETVSALGGALSQGQTAQQRALNDQLSRVEFRLESIRGTVEQKLTAIQQDNGQRLEQMRQTVDEKLQKTLDQRLAQSFTQVSERLEQVYKGLGEMQTLAMGVGDLKKVLSNVKTRGILGEVQLAAILDQILSPEQYYTNVSTKKGSSTVVEFAVRLPGDGEYEVLLPVDAKFPADCYSALMDAYEGGDSEAIALAGKELERRIKSAAKDIRDKYLDPPGTTDFAILFLPFEGLYAEVVRRGMIETLARDYRVNIAGPTTMAALLNSLQMGFRTLAIQKRSGEVWQVLGAVKTEFGKFATVLESAQSRLRKTNEELDTLIGTRTRAIERKLRTVTELTGSESAELLELPPAQ